MTIIRCQPIDHDNHVRGKVLGITYDRLKEVKEQTRIPLGALLDEAVEQWWESLPEAEDA